jgi:uncharacterized protein (DUF169 family)
MNNFRSLTKRLIAAMEIPDIVIPVSGVKFFKKIDIVPDTILQFQPDHFSITSCHALKASMLDDAVYLGKESIGCVAAAISLGLVEKKEHKPLKGKRVYIELMRKSSGKGKNFTAPSPLDFSNGSVYACKDSGHQDFGLFGKDDSGRYKSKDIAVEAIARMPSIQPAIMQGVFYFSPEYDDTDIIPDVVVLSLRPVELCRIIQGYQFLTGERVRADIGGLRAGCSDLIVKPYLYNEINFSPYCLGARLLAKFEGDRMGLGMPYSFYELTVQGVEDSKTGFPFSKYPGAAGGP